MNTQPKEERLFFVPSTHSDHGVMPPHYVVTSTTEETALLINDGCKEVSDCPASWAAAERAAHDSYL